MRLHLYLASTTARAALCVFALAVLAYGATAAWVYSTDAPKEAYFDLLAQSFLEGRLDLEAPRGTHDLTEHGGRWYVPFPPLPALLLLPWVALFGLAHTNTVWLAVLLGAANVTLVLLLLETLSARGVSRLARRDNLWLTLAFGLGSVHWSIAPLGTVWYTAQLATVAFSALAACLTMRGASPWLCGAALALAMAARPHVALLFPLLLGLHAERRPGGFRGLLGFGLRALAPMGLALGLLSAYNQARFGQPLEFGYGREQVADELRGRRARHGLFSLRHVRRNLDAMLLAGPRWSVREQRYEPDPHGLSLLLTTPALVYLWRAGLRRPATRAAWLALLLLCAPLLLYYNTGWWQFGYRFSLDFMVPAMVLLALAAGPRVSRLLQALILAGLLVCAWGVWWWGDTWYPRGSEAALAGRRPVFAPGGVK